MTNSDSKMSSSATKLCNGSSSGTAAEPLTRAKPTISTSSLKRKSHVNSPPPRALLPSQSSTHKLTPLSLPPLDAITRFKNETLRVYGVLEIQLSGKYTGEPRDYLAGAGKGKYSVADIGTWPWVKGWAFSGFTDEEMKQFPHLLKWIDRIAERPAVKRGVGEKYSQPKK